jgi:hypothetical protein
MMIDRYASAGFACHGVGIAFFVSKSDFCTRTYH